MNKFRGGGRNHRGPDRSNHRSDHRREPRNHGGGANSERLIVGRNSVLELLRFAPERIERVLCVDGERDERFQEIVNLAQQHSLPINMRDSYALSGEAGTDSHQGVAAVVKERRPVPIAELLENCAGKERSILVMFDSIYDPHNVGAMLRASECFGVDGVIYSKNRGSPITAVVTKSAVGATELVPMCVVSNLAQTVSLAKDQGFFIASADAGEGAVPLADFVSPEKLLLIMGSEGDGVQPLLKKLSDVRLEIPMKGRIDSLNVSQALSVMLYAVTAQKA